MLIALCVDKVELRSCRSGFLRESFKNALIKACKLSEIVENQKPFLNAHFFAYRRFFILAPDTSPCTHCHTRCRMGPAWQVTTSSLHAGQWVKLCGHQVCLWCQLTKLTDGGGQQSILGHHRIVRLAGCVGRAILMHSGYAAWDCGQVVKMVIFSKRQQFIWKFGWCIFFIRLFSLMPFIILGWAIYNNKEGLPWRILVMNLQIKHKSHQMCPNKYL